MAYPRTELFSQFTTTVLVAGSPSTSISSRARPSDTWYPMVPASG